MKRVAFTSIIVMCLLTSCSTSIYYYNNSDMYAIQRGKDLTYYYTGHKYGFNSADYYNTYAETNE
jgi:hypothetical protein